MTAEVSVMNRLGVALAADSAVTIGQDAKKIHTSADKLFQLTPQSSIGVMIYGNANFVGLPWETVVKTYRKECKSKTEKTVDDYASNLISFLTKTKKLFPQDRQDISVAQLAYSHLISLREQLFEKLDEVAVARSKKGGLDAKDIPKIVTDEVKDVLTFVRKRKLIKGFDKTFRDRMKKRYTPIITKLRKEVFDTLPISSSTSRNIATFIHEILWRELFGPMKTGIVVAGFGEDDFLPTLINYELEEMIGGRPRLSLIHI